MNRYFRLNPEVDVGLELWRDVNMLCQSLHSDDVEDFWRTQDMRFLLMVATCSLILADHRVHGCFIDAAILDVAATVSAACIIDLLVHLVSACYLFLQLLSIL
ncbi:hypothetical protein Tco_0969796 [Tanacetum coccineum]